MSSLRNSYRKIINKIDNGVFTREVDLVSKGRIYRAEEVDINVLATAKMSIVVTTGTDAVIFKERIIQSLSAKSLIKIYETPTGVTGGTPVTQLNTNFNSSRAALTSMLLNPTIGGVGTDLETPVMVRGTAGARNTSLAAVQNDDFVILKPSTDYLFEMTNLGADADYDFVFRYGELESNP